MQLKLYDLNSKLISFYFPPFLCYYILISCLQEVPDNEFEKRIRPEVIPANEIGVTFADIGALDEIKESLQEVYCFLGLLVLEKQC